MKNTNAIKKYYVGFALLSLLSIGIAAYVLMQGVAGKQDIQTNKKANEIAKDLNNYIAKNRTIPENLEEADIRDVPNTIKYTKKDSSSFEFCVTYKSDKSYASNGVMDVLWGSALRSNSFDDDMYESDYTPSTLYLPYSYKKGENCQTVEPYSLRNSRSTSLFNSLTTTSNNNSSTSSTSLKTRDTERQNDIKALHGQIEAYYAQNGYYPTFANMNDATFRSVNMKGLDTEALKDPVGKLATLKSSAAKNYYSYTVTSASGGACDNAANDCAMYTLTATLEAGGTYTKTQLN